MLEKHTGGLEVKEYIQQQMEQGLVEAQQHIQKMPDGKSQEVALKGLSELKGKYQQALSQPPKPSNPAETFKELRAQLNEACRKAESQSSGIKTPLPADAQQKIASGMDNLAGFKQKMLATLDKLEPLAMEAPKKIEEAKQQAEALKNDPKLAQMSFRKLSRPELEQAYARGSHLNALISVVWIFRGSSCKTLIFPAHCFNRPILAGAILVGSACAQRSPIKLTSVKPTLKVPI
nr:hypothetical protein [Dongshaea marina]